MPEFKLFTLEEAERTLPLVRRIVADLTLEYPAWRAAVARFELLTGGARADWGETEELVASREEVTRHADRINRYLQELEAIGCVFKGFEAGLVDFYSLQGRPSRLPMLAAGRGTHRALARHRHRLHRQATHRRSHPVRHALVTRAWLFLHLLGFTLWLGGAIAAMIMGIAARREDRHGFGAVVRAQGSLMKVGNCAGCAAGGAVGSDSDLPSHRCRWRDGGIQHLAGHHAGGRSGGGAAHITDRSPHGIEAEPARPCRRNCPLF